VFSLCGSFVCLHVYDCLGDLFELFSRVFYYGDVCSVIDSVIPFVVGGIWCCLCEVILKGILCEYLAGGFGFNFVLF